MRYFIWLAAMASVIALPAQDSAAEFFRLIRANDVAKLRVLAKDRASVNVADSRGMTSLLYASAFGSIESMRLLLDAGANVNAKNFQDATALHWGAWDPARVRLLVEKGADVNARTKQGRTALIIAAGVAGSYDSVALLLAKGADSKAADEMGVTALHAAASRGDNGVLRLLIEAGADVNSLDKGGFPPLTQASGDLNLSAVKLLLAKGARVNVANTFAGEVKFGPIALRGLTPLMLSCAFGSPELVRTLLDAGADVKARDSRGMTALMFAVSSETQDPRVAKLLLDRGSDVNAKSEAGETALDWARKFSKPEVMALLEKAGAKGATVAPPPTPAGAKDARLAVDRGLRLLQTTSGEFFKQSGCVGCHHQPSTALAVEKAKAAGLPVNQQLAAEQARSMPLGMAYFQQPMLQGIELPGSIDQLMSNALGMASYGLGGDLTSDSMVAHLVTFQRGHGGWSFMFGVSRAPFEERDIARTAYAARVLRVYGWPARQPEFDARIARARAWLLEAKPQTSYERAERLLGLKWSGAAPAQIAAAAKQLLAEQRTDGGWAQNRYLSSDPYATGFALYALREAAALDPRQTAYRRGAEFLLKTQHADGSWYVRSRAPKFQPYFESGFPHGHDQWISATATAYAVAALVPVVNGGSERAARYQ